MDKTIELLLNEESFNRAISDLKAWKQELKERTQLFQERIAEVIAELAQRGYDTAMSGTVVGFGNSNVPATSADILAVKPEITVTCEHGNKYSVVIASGKYVCFIEFGTGVYYNGSAGTSMHPKGAELGLTIGSYGKGNGRKEIWGYYGETGELILTRGVRAQPFLYQATVYIAEHWEEIAQGVF